MGKDASYWIEKLGLRQHPEGGYFREVYRSEHRISGEALPFRYDGDRCLCTAIYFLLTGDDISAFHRLHSDELWFYHAGAPLDVFVLPQESDDMLKQIRLGCNQEGPDTPMCRLQRHHYFGAQVADDRSYTLVSCVVTPGFEFADFELADRDWLLAQYPRHSDIIRRLTYPS